MVGPARETPVALPGPAAKNRRMTGDIEGLGAAVTAGLAARAVEPRHGGGPVPASTARCLNCGTSLAGSHCHQCGQKVAIHRSFAAIGHDLVHAIFHFEGKLWNTLPLLTWRPGDLTGRYIHGERARFISPLALFLFAVFLTYAVLAMLGSGANPSGGTGLVDAAAKQTQVNAARNGMKAELARLDAKIASGTGTVAERAQWQQGRTVILRSAKMMGLVDEKNAPNRISDSAQNDFSLVDVKTGVPFIDHGIEKANDNPGLLFYKLQANAYKFAWALIPLSMPFLWLLYPFSGRFHLYDHFVFITYSLSFMLLLFVFVRLMNLSVLGGVTTAIAIPYIPFHMYRQLRGAYRSSRFGALLRTGLLLVFCAFNIVTFMLLLLAMGIMG